MTASHTDRPFDAVEGATALSATRFHFMWTYVSADSPSSAPLLSPYFPFFPLPGFGFCYWVRGARFGITTVIGLSNRAPIGVLVFLSPTYFSPVVWCLTPHS